jgi:branched-chain amino acid transport system permease protein
MGALTGWTLAMTGAELSQALVIGVITGAVYSLLGLGLVLVYKASGVFNFAQAEFGGIAVYGAYLATQVYDLPYWVAVVLGLTAAVVVGLLAERFVIRPLSDAPRITLLVATVGIALLAIGIEFWRTNDNPVKTLAPMLPTTDRVSVFGVQVSDQRLATLAVLGIVAVALAAFFRSRRGLTVLAASQDPVASELVGVSVTKVSRLTWGLAALLGGVAGLLYAPSGPFSPGFLTQQALIPAFTGVVIGGVTSLQGAAIGGLVVGVLQALGGTSALDFPGASALVVFLLLLAVLLVRPQGVLAGKAPA